MSCGTNSCSCSACNSCCSSSNNITSYGNAVVDQNGKKALFTANKTMTEFYLVTDNSNSSNFKIYAGDTQLTNVTTYFTNSYTNSTCNCTLYYYSGMYKVTANISSGTTIYYQSTNGGRHMATAFSIS